MRWKSISPKWPRALRESVSEVSTATAFNSATTRSINSSNHYILTAKCQRLPSETKSWLDYSSYLDAGTARAFDLLLNIRWLDNVIKLAVEG
jgi:hypothetical protein